MNIYFKLRARGKSNPKIELQIFDGRFKGRKFLYSTGISINPNHWDKRKNRPKPTPYQANEDELKRLSHHLDHIQEIALKFLGDRYGAKSLDREELKKHIDSLLNPGNESGIQSSDLYIQWEELVNTTKNPKTGTPITSGTKRSKKQTLELLKVYFNKVKIDPTFHSFDITFYHTFDEFMIQKGLNENTRGKHFKEIKAVLREAEDRDIEVNRSYQKKSFKVIRSNPDNVYLNDDEIKKIYALKLTTAQGKLRDIFVMACYVGARHSDWDQITSKNIITENKKELLRIKQTKTGEIVHIPLHDAVRSILNKYKDELPKVITNQKFNEALKTICEKAELGTVVIGKTEISKSDLITTHTARRSFATNAYLSRSMDVYQIMHCTGHKSESSFLRYLKLDGKDFAIQAADSSFFKDPSWSMKIAS